MEVIGDERMKSALKRAMNYKGKAMDEIYVDIDMSDHLQLAIERAKDNPDKKVIMYGSRHISELWLTPLFMKAMSFPNTIYVKTPLRLANFLEECDKEKIHNPALKAVGDKRYENFVVNTLRHDYRANKEGVIKAARDILGWDGSDEEIKRMLLLDHNTDISLNNQHFPGVFCDIDGTLMMYNGEVNKDVLQLLEKYDEEKLGKLIDLNSGTEGLQSMREELADSISLLKRSDAPEEKKELMSRIEELKDKIKRAKKDGKEEEKIKKNNKLLQERAKLIEEKEAKRKEFRWKQFQEEEKERDRLRDLEREDWIKREKEAIDAVVDKYMTSGDLQGLAEVLDQAYGAGSKIYAERNLDLNNKLQEKKARRLKYSFNSNLDKKIHEIEELNRVMNPQLERLNAKKYLISEEEYKTQLKDLMMKENEKRAEIEAMAASREQDSQSKTMLDFVDQQKDMVDNLNEDMKNLREYAFKPHKVKDKHLKNEIKKLNEKYNKDLNKLKKEEEEEVKRQIEEIKNRYKKDENMLERQLDEYRDNLENFKSHNKNFMAEQLARERERLGNELTEDEKTLLMAKYERKMANLNKALEKEHGRQVKGHTDQMKEKQKEIEMKKREREILLNNLSMYKDSRAKQIAYEDNFEKLASMVEEDLELIDQEAYSGPKMQIYDLIKFKRESDEYLDVLRGDVGLLERVKRIENHVQSIETSYKNRKMHKERLQKQ